MSSTLTLPPYGAEEEYPFEVPIVSEGPPHSLTYDNQTFLNLLNILGVIPPLQGTALKKLRAANLRATLQER
jgi:hypothetical protein